MLLNFKNFAYQIIDLLQIKFKIMEYDFLLIKITISQLNLSRKNLFKIRTETG